MDGVALVANPPNVRRHHGARRLLLYILPPVLLLAAMIQAHQPQPTFSSIADNAILPVTAPAEFTFRLPVARTIQVRVTPHVDGEVRYSLPLIGDRLYRRVAFVPAQTWQPGVAYSIALTDVASAVPGWQRQSDYTFQFTAAPAPTVASISPNADQVLLADAAFRVQLNSAVDASTSFGFTLEPAIPVTSELSEDKKTYVITPTQLLPQGDAISLNIQRTVHRLDFATQEIAEQGTPETLSTQKWQVRTAPGVASVEPQGVNQSLTTPIVIVLTEAASLENFTKAVSVVPPVVGEWTTSDNRTFTLTHEPLAQYTTYTVTLANTLRTQDGGFLPTTTPSQFRTIGPVRLESSTPAHKAVGVGVRSSPRFTFDQDVNTTDTVKHFRISPSVQGTFSWSGNTLRFTPAKALAFDTTYTVTLTKGIVGLAGFPSAQDMTVQFTTEHAVTRLAVPFHRQEHKLSCEIATLVMALRYRGISIGEQTIIDAIGFDPTPKKNGIWGDPDVAFVGDIDGQQPGTGYGVNAAPIAKAGSAYRTTRAFKNGTLTDVLNEVKAGNPVIVWGNAASGRRVDWRTPTGKTVLAIVGEHTRVVVGFTGSASNPVSIITLDPLFGEKRFTKNAFLADWALLGNMGVVVE